jgi:response regulator NasT
LLEKSQLDHVMGFLTKPVTMQALSQGIDVALRRFKQFEVVRGQANSSAGAGSDWHVVCQAKQLLLAATPQSEDAAFERLLELARATNQGVARAAQAVVSAYNLAEK